MSIEYKYKTLHKSTFVHHIQTITSNIHYLCHIADDLKRFGNINSISTYHHPLEQIAKRLAEMDFRSSKNSYQNYKIDENHTENRPKVKFPIDGDVKSFQILVSL